jgi:hypothetical protein
VPEVGSESVPPVRDEPIPLVPASEGEVPPLPEDPSSSSSVAQAANEKPKSESNAIAQNTLFIAILGKG